MTEQQQADRIDKSQGKQSMGERSDQKKELEEGFVFTCKDYSKLLECGECHSLMIEPTRLYPCGHTFCKACVNKTKKCYIPHPYCGKYFMAAQSDLIASHLIDDLQGVCKVQGCSWTGTLERYKKRHRGNCDIYKAGGLENWKRSIGELAELVDREKRSRPIDIDEEEENRQIQNQMLLQSSAHLNENPIKRSLFANVNLCQDNGHTIEPINPQSRQLLGSLNKYKVGSLPRKNSSIYLSINEHPEKGTKNHVEEIDLDGDQNETHVEQSQQKILSDKITDQGVQKKYRGNRILNSYKKKSHKILEDPHNLNLF